MKKGFTLVESLVIAVVGAIIGAGIVSFLYVFNNVNNRVIVNSRVQAIAGLVTNYLSNDIRRSNKTEVSGDSKTLTIFLDTDTIQYSFKDQDFLRNGSSAIPMYDDAFLDSSGFELNFDVVSCNMNFFAQERNKLVKIDSLLVNFRNRNRVQY